MNWGNVPVGAVLPFGFDTFGKTNPGSITMSGFAVTDIEVYKGTSMTQRASDNGYSLLDADGIDLDGITGIQGFSIDTSDNSDSGFWEAGSFYRVVISTITVDGETVSFHAGNFRLVAAESVAGEPKVDVAAFGGTAGTFSSGIPETKVASIAANSITAASINSDAITADKIADGAIDNATLASDVRVKLHGAQPDYAPLKSSDYKSPVAATGTVTGVISQFEFQTDLTQVDGFWHDAPLRFMTGNNAGANPRPINAYDQANGTIYLANGDGFAGTIQVGDTFEVISDHIHTLSATAGETVSELLGELTENHTTPGTIGKAIGDTVADTNELQTDWANGGRLDMLIDAILADTGTDGVVVAAGSKSGYSLAGTITSLDALLTKVRKYFQLIFRSDAAIATDNATELTELNASGGSGAGDASNQMESLEAIRDRGDAAWTTGGGGGGGLTEQNIQDIANLTSQEVVSDITGERLRYIPPDLSGELKQTTQGMDYLASLGNRLEWSDINADWPILTGATITVRIDQGSDPAVEFTGDVITATGSNKKVGLELTAAETPTIATADGEVETTWRYIVFATIAGEKSQLRTGRWLSSTLPGGLA